MKITDKIISIPPYLSTSWDKVTSLHMEGEQLVITLKDGTAVTLPYLAPDVIEQIFSAHVNFLEESFVEKLAKESSKKASQGIEQLFGAPFRLSLGSIEAIGQSLQHNPAYRDLPPIPTEIVEKISALAKNVSEEDIRALPVAEQNCNCIYCQMSRILKQAGLPESKDLDRPLIDEFEEEVKEEDLRFEEWEVKNIGEKLYTVTHKLDAHMQYNVFLGTPVGCTCGKPNCEHIVVVLRH